MLIKKRLVILSPKIELFFSEVKSLFFVRGLLGCFVLKFPSFFFYKLAKNNFSFVFLNRFFYFAILKHFQVFYKRLFFFSYIKFKIKGLGYRIRKITNSLYRFFFGHTNFFYFHIPANVIAKARKRKFILLSNDVFLLKLIFAHMLLLKRISVYRIRGLVYPRYIVILKIGKKNM